MNANKICFITCVNDDDIFQKCLSYIKDLEVPVGYVIETISIKDVSSMPSGFNRAMRNSDAKYKVYLHQDVFIINKSFIPDMLKIFDNPRIGMIGVVGSKKIPTNGIWWESGCNYGKVYESHTGIMKLLSFKEVEQGYEEVLGIDGLIMITQYDIAWREDIFTGWHFYDLSQSMEFVRAGYKVVIPSQSEAWCVHDCGIVNVTGYQKFRHIFLKEYAKDLFPLVSVLIPAYNQTNYLEKALLSALNQDYYNCEIVICDDSTTEDVRILVEQYLTKHDHIRYFNNGGPLGGRGTVNLQKCFDLCNGEYVSYLLHDDLYMPNKISVMMGYLINDVNVILVTSYRKLINGTDNFLPDLLVTRPLYNVTTRVAGSVIGRYILKNIANVIGEMSTTLFRKADVTGKLLDFCGYQLSCLGDVGLWLKLLAKGDLIYIRNPLSCFRIHSGQNTYTTALELSGAIDWYKLINLTYKEQLYLSDEDYKAAINGWVRCHRRLMTKDTVSLEEKNLQAELVSLYNDAIEKLKIFKVDTTPEYPTRA
ncbi:glycosyltransferase [Sporomusa acidovorans]|uniref:GalNAc(5)-diNAcBac-PP-undecaprenol beta-1,3-glucosyltransferase n=1 Tax=Sporomusa acidovorans (strain ATCC 49682 / DSM 3132 / Mol) TaxID=1123286 RepID=A0ABZ3J9S9_SPOA4|nr:glycosyltransferase [Sporomusa acidovorans]OZC15134.1 GalNAc(5)-diNAcBac-PP-undecaprenol beta-1,3-glucosyltransferase [Sporomusa acidovorans DSM 3132]SDF44242.1 Glycosyltransferase involved in cell wall bisynthesis [Sporomusa acidovorans]